MSTLIGLTVILSIFAISALVKRAKKRYAPEVEVLRPMRAPRAPFGIFVDNAHSWVRMMSDGSLRVGVDDLLAESLGTIEGVEVPYRRNQSGTWRHTDDPTRGQAPNRHPRAYQR